MITEDELRETARRLIDQHRGDDQTTFLDAQFEAGLAWVHFREGEGGLGLSPKWQEIVDTELEAAGRRYSFARNPMGIGMVGPAIETHGTPEQLQHLRRAFTAEDLWCQMFSEPGAGSDVATLATRAVRDGDEWIVNGQKVWTSLAHLAKYGLLLARTDPDVPKHEGITAFIIDMHAPGVDVRPLRQMSGESHFNEVYFTDARVPDSARVGETGDGWRVAVTTLMNERVSIGGTTAPRGSGAIGAAVAAWKARPEAERDPVRRDELLRLWTEAEVHRLGNMRAQQLRERGTPGPEGSVLKLGGALLSQRIASFTVNLLGPSGMLLDYSTGEPGAVHSLVASQASTIAGGTSEVMRNILGERILGLPGEPRTDKGVPWSQIPKGV